MLISLVITLLLLNPLSSAYFSDKLFFDIETVEDSSIPERINPENIGVKVTAQSYAVIDVASGKLLAQQGMNETQPIASITKLMTALIILAQNPDWQTVVEMQQADETNGAYPHVYRGEQVKFIDLWKAALVTSDNNAIKAMIRALNFSEPAFVELMNKKAAELEMRNSRFHDPTGLSEKNISTALDIARLLNFAMKKDEIRASVLQPKYNFPILNNRRTRTIYNTDILVDSFLNKSVYGYELLGGKTGFLPAAGYCLAVKIKKDNREVIAVVLNSQTMADRFQDVKVLVDWVFSNYQW